MRLIPLQIGQLAMHMGAITGVDEMIDFPILSWLIEHPEGLVLFDTGMHIDLQTSVDRIGADTAKRMTPDFSPGQELSGHQSLRVELESGPVVLTGDCVYMESMLDAMQVPTMASERAQAQHLESMRYLASLRDDHGCRLLFGHDQAQFQSIPADGIV